MSMKRTLSLDELHISQESNANKSAKTSTQPEILLEESDDQDDVGNYVEETTLKAENEERADLHQLLDELDDRQGRDGQTFEDSDGEPAVQPKSPTNQNREESQTEQKRAEARQALANSIVDARMPQSNSDHAIVNFINADIRTANVQTLKKLVDETSNFLKKKELIDRRINTKGNEITAKQEELDRMTKYKQSLETKSKELAKDITDNQERMEALKKELFQEIDLEALTRVTKK